MFLIALLISINLRMFKICIIDFVYLYFLFNLIIPLSILLNL